MSEEKNAYHRGYMAGRKMRDPNFCKKIAASQKSSRMKTRARPEYAGYKRGRGRPRNTPEQARTAKARYNATQLRKRGELSAFIWSWKETHPCVGCGEADPVVLDFDHRDPKKKSFNVASAPGLVRKRSRIVAEIKKCDMRCANCHRRRSFKKGHGNQRKFFHFAT